MILDPTTLRDVSGLVVVFGVPALVIVPRMKTAVVATFVRVLISVGMTWACIIGWFYFIAVPVAKSLGEQKAEVLIAGAHVVPYGWIPAAIGSFVVAGLCLLFQNARRKRHSAPP